VPEIVPSAAYDPHRPAEDATACERQIAPHQRLRSDLAALFVAALSRIDDEITIVFIIFISAREYDRLSARYSVA